MQHTSDEDLSFLRWSPCTEEDTQLGRSGMIAVFLLKKGKPNEDVCLRFSYPELVDCINTCAPQSSYLGIMHAAIYAYPQDVPIAAAVRVSPNTTKTFAGVGTSIKGVKVVPASVTDGVPIVPASVTGLTPQ